MLPRHHDPIVAIATAPGRGAVGIVRVSGARLVGLIQGLFGRALPARQASLLPFDDENGEPIDHGLALYFPAPHSYTGEDVLELQAHGGPVVLQLLLARCLTLAQQHDPQTGRPRAPGLRVANPGEFTERAFLNDKLDLAQAEAVADLIDAGTEAAARSASRSLAGALSTQVHALAERLIRLRTLVEATLDFPEEEIDFLRQADALGQLQSLTNGVASLLARSRQGALLRDGLRLVLAGQPNVGKSSLLNALAGAELAIVTPIPGTTRDRISETIQIEGVPIHVTDTAGLRDDTSIGPALDEVERIGIERSWSAIEGADAVVFLHDLTRRGTPDYEAAEVRIAQQLIPLQKRSVALLHVSNKADLVTAGGAAAVRDEVRVSAQTGQGLDTLRQRLLECAGWQPHNEGLFIARARHVQALTECAAHLACAHEELAAHLPALDLLAEELRLAHNALGTITGAYTANDLLGEIFGRFCIGK